MHIYFSGDLPKQHAIGCVRFRCFNKGTHAESREQTEDREVLDETKFSAEQDVVLQSH